LAPFDPEREPPTGRYSLPGEEIAVEEIEEEPRRELPPPPAFQVLGTGAATEGAIAVIRIENGTPRILRVGDDFNGYRVASIDRGRVTMASPERSLSLMVSQASPTGPQPVQEGRRQQGRQGNNNGNNNNGNNAEARRALEAAAARLQAGGMTPAARQELMRRVQELQMSGGPVNFVAGDRVITTGPGGQQVEVSAEMIIPEGMRIIERRVQPRQ
jgi:hypothetical protein